MYIGRAKFLCTPIPEWRGEGKGGVAEINDKTFQRTLTMDTFCNEKKDDQKVQVKVLYV